MLYRSVENSIVADTLPQTVVALADWDAHAGKIPGEAVFAALGSDLKVAVEARNHTRLGSRLNHNLPGAASLFRKTGRKLKQFTDEHYQAQFLAVDTRWGNMEIWAGIQRLGPPLTISYFLDSLDARQNLDGISFKPEQERIYLLLFARTVIVSLVITGLCILLGYPLAYLLAQLPLRSSNLLLILVLLPFWTSLLVRTSAWKALLQQQGVINDLLFLLGFVADDNRLSLINNMTGTIITMVHILLPYMILSLFSVMRGISPTWVRAAKSMGASNWTSFWRVYFPNTIAGIGAGSILVFILSIGFYITPELVGGREGVFISNRIAYHILSSLNWGLAAALGTSLLIIVLILYWLYEKFIGIDKLKLT